MNLASKFSLLVCLPTAAVSYFSHPQADYSPLLAALLCALLFSTHPSQPPPSDNKNVSVKDREEQESFYLAPPPPPPPVNSDGSIRPIRPHPNSAEDRIRASISKERLEMALKLVEKLKSTLEYDHALFAPNLVNAKRFLQARNWNEQVAEKLWRKAALWRIEYKFTERRARLAKLRQMGPGFDAKHDFIERHWFQYPLANDMNGVPCLVLGASTADPYGIAQETDAEDGFMDRILDSYERVLEVAIERDVLDFGLLEVFDLREIPLVPNYFSRATNSVMLFKSFAKIADEVYVERVRKVVLVGPPRMFSFIWNVFLPLIPAETKKKLSVLGKPDDWIKEFAKQGITREALPINYGGLGSDENIKIGKCVPKGSFKTFQVKEFVPSAREIGLIADVQYADENDGWNFAKTRLRKYRSSFDIGLCTAVTQWKELGVKTVVQLGDLIDDGARKKSSQLAWDKCQTALLGFNQVHQLIGNHEMYNFPNKHGLPSYRAVDVAEDSKFRWIFLDSYDVSVLGVETSPEYKQALTVLLGNHPRDFRKDKDWLRDRYSLQRRFVPYNGQVSQTQLDWLRKELEQCIINQQFALVCTHVLVKPGSGAASCLLWNYDQVLLLLQEFACSKHQGQSGVVSVFSGHDHRGGFAIDSSGIAYITLTSPLEASHSLSYSTLQLGREGFWLKGFGVEQERIIKFCKSSIQAQQVFEQFAIQEITQFHQACQAQGKNKTWHECEVMWMQHEGSWDELPSQEWPKKFID
ncbi:hypothetical protein BASA81_003181 [Batrachochytrium salamandrivorans]|nr:hypothetical protein BASA81_003181 [Batrachochytrium salamandrivorans]